SGWSRSILSRRNRFRLADPVVQYGLAPFETDNRIEGRLIHGGRDFRSHDDETPSDEGAAQVRHELFGGRPGQPFEGALDDEDARPAREAAYEIDGGNLARREIAALHVDWRVEPDPGDLAIQSPLRQDAADHALHRLCGTGLVGRDAPEEQVVLHAR